jgi:hypothetical protein
MVVGGYRFVLKDSLELLAKSDLDKLSTALTCQ